MGRINRYVVGELLKTFMLALVGLTLFMILVGVVTEAIRQGLGPKPLLRLIPFLLPDALRFTVPGTLLFAVCRVFGRMSADNEVTALKSVGITPMTILWPTFLLALSLSLISVWLNDVAVSWGRKGVQRVGLQSLEQIVYGMLRSNRSYSSPQFSISVLSVQGKKLIQPTITVYGGGNAPQYTLTASEAELRLDPDNGMLDIHLVNSEGDLGSRFEFSLRGSTSYSIPWDLATRKSRSSSRPSEIPLRQIPPELTEQEEQLESMRQEHAAEAAMHLLAADFGALTPTRWQAKDRDFEDATSRKFRLRTEPWRRWANGFSCFFFILVGAPWAIQRRNADLWTTFGSCFFPILIIYYPLLMLGTDRAKNGALPPYSVWIANLLLLVIGGVLIRRMCRH